MEHWTSGRFGIIVIGFVFAAMAAACGGNDAVEVSGSTGTCDLPGDVYTCETETSDDRVSGIAEIAIHCEFTEDGDTTLGDCSGPAIVTNAGGTWEGTCEGTTTWSTSKPDHVHVFDCTYLGTGDYEGLRYVEHLEGVDFPWPLTGRIEPIE
jgi:hypothetical protein